jgi:hypothetical protein
MENAYGDSTEFTKDSDGTAEDPRNHQRGEAPR